MADGSYKNIEDIKVGEKVMSYDEKTGEMKIGRVTKVYHHDKGEMSDFYLVINDFLRVTPNHLLLTEKGWKEAGKLKVGDALKDGEIVYSIKFIHEKVEIYNLEVEPYYNYVVGIIVAHNAQEDIEGDFREFTDDSDFSVPTYYGGEQKAILIPSKKDDPDNPPPPQEALPPGAIEWVWDKDTEKWYPLYPGIAEPGIKDRDTVESYDFIVDDFEVIEGDNSEEYVIAKVKLALSGDLPYAILDYDKIMALKELSYDKAKETLGIDWRYDFMIRITSYNGSVILEYPKGVDLSNADIVAKFTRNVVVFKGKDLEDLNISSVDDIAKIPSMVKNEVFLANFEMVVYR